jgi:hypothetical protein
MVLNLIIPHHEVTYILHFPARGHDNPPVAASPARAPPEVTDSAFGDPFFPQLKCPVDDLSAILPIF